MRPSLLKKLHQIFLFPDRNEKDNKDPDKDLAMKKINKHAMTKFSDALAAWKTRLKHRIVDKKEPLLPLEHCVGFPGRGRDDAAK